MKSHDQVITVDDLNERAEEILRTVRDEGCSYVVFEDGVPSAWLVPLNGDGDDPGLPAKAHDRSAAIASLISRSEAIGEELERERSDLRDIVTIVAELRR